ncbi:MAG TPA: 16S rRNA (uracil(1498)-N(3))-methyltransferase [Fulvivirga sp.]|nr:16S rRNA (uracil(1498)-N(3))-methyltransferase [Fulvivirga sp.]
MQLFYEPNITGDQFLLNEDEARHCIKVLRKKADDLINIIDGQGNFYVCEIKEAHSKKCLLAIKEKSPEEKRAYNIHLAIAPTKNIDRIEWLVEKAVEIGIDELSFVICQNSERQQLKLDRVEKKAISAMKQSLKASLPKINPITKFSDFLKADLTGQKFIGYVDSTNPLHLKEAASKNDRYHVLIGPEGDFSNTELLEAEKAGFKKISLGKSRLRTETAGLVACHILNLIND